MTREELDQADSSQRQHNEIMRHQSDITAHVEREEYNLFSLLKPELFIDGNKWCCLYGENIQDGIAGFGNTPWKSIIDFNFQWHEPLVVPAK
jgi:hypothetical protein